MFVSLWMCKLLCLMSLICTCLHCVLMEATTNVFFVFLQHGRKPDYREKPHKSLGKYLGFLLQENQITAWPVKQVKGCVFLLAPTHHERKAIFCWVFFAPLFLFSRCAFLVISSCLWDELAEKKNAANVCSITRFTCLGHAIQNGLEYFATVQMMAAWGQKQAEAPVLGNVLLQGDAKY